MTFKWCPPGTPKGSNWISEGTQVDAKMDLKMSPNWIPTWNPKWKPKFTHCFLLQNGAKMEPKPGSFSMARRTRWPALVIVKNEGWETKQTTNEPILMDPQMGPPSGIVLKLQKLMVINLGLHFGLHLKPQIVPKWLPQWILKLNPEIIFFVTFKMDPKWYPK